MPPLPGERDPPHYLFTISVYLHSLSLRHLQAHEGHGGREGANGESGGRGCVAVKGPLVNSLENGGGTEKGKGEIEGKVEPERERERDRVRERV